MADYFDVNNEELLKDFFSEAEQQVETLESNILVLENEPENSESMDEIFRAAHTLKGGSATVEMTELAEFTHVVEDLLDELRSNSIKTTEEIINILLLAIDVIKAMLVARSNGSIYQDDVEPLKASIRSFLPQKQKKTSTGGLSKLFSSPVEVPMKNEPITSLPHPSSLLSEYDVLELNELCSKDKKLFGVTVVFDKTSVNKVGSGQTIFATLKKETDVLKTIPEFDTFHTTFHDKIVYYVAASLSAEKLEDCAFIDDIVFAVDAQEITEEKITTEVPVSSQTVTSTQCSTIPSTLPSPKSHLKESELIELHSMCGDKEKLFGVSVLFDENNPMNSVGAIQVYVALKEKGTVIRSIPDFDALYGEDFHPMVVYYVSTKEVADTLEDVAFLDDAVLAVDAQVIEKIIAEPALPQAVMQEEVVVPAVSKPIEKKKTSASPSAAVNASGSILRVDSKRIDYLLNLVSETVITKAAFNQTLSLSNKLLSDFQTLNTDYKDKVRKLLDQFPRYVEQVSNGMPITEAKAALNTDFTPLFSQFDEFDSQYKGFEDKFRSYTQNLARVTGELQEGVMKIRMVPINQIFSRFPRVVRDLTHELNKKINLVIEGEETELDKSVVEDLLDPIMHCVRNSVDHGIEIPSDRIANGKDEEGTLLLKASNEGNMIVIEVRDDGKGIDVEKVREKAIERGLIHASRVISDEEAFQFIFDPGFSTAKKITNVSGRGVGLDVVKTQIEKLKGTVVVSSEANVGTTFTIKLPLTLAIIQGLLVQVGKEVYSIPIASVIESQRINIKDLKSIDNYEVMTVRDEVISVLRLNRLFNIKEEENSDNVYIVIVGTADKKLGIMVDSLISEEDIVIKPLTDQFISTPGIAGASILGDGSVSLIIDVSQLLSLGIKLELTAREEKSYLH